MKTSLNDPVAALYGRTISPMHPATVIDRRYNLPKPKFPLRLLCVLGVLAMNSSSFAATTITETFTVNAAIPDNDDTGWADTRVITAPGLDEIVDVNVGLVFSGGWNGDLYAYLVHGSGFSVLLNRVGRTAGNDFGSGSSGMNIILDDDAVNEAHVSFANTGFVTSTYQPDARVTDPWFVLDTDARTALLGSFDGLDPNGGWTLFVADQSAGDTSTLQSWSLTITAVPEPGTAMLGLLGAGLFILRRRIRD